MDEQVFLELDGATVTSSKIVIGASTYATRNVGSVRIDPIPMPLMPFLVGLVGLVMMSRGNADSLGFGLFILAIAGYWIYSKLGRKKLILLAGSGEVVALETKDSDLLQQLHDAIVSAISAR